MKNLERNTRSEVLLRGKRLKIITGYDCQLQRNSSVTVEELEDYRDRATLFLYTQGVNLIERLGLAPKLQAVLVKDKVILLTSKMVEIVFGTDKYGIKQCLASGCLNSLGQTCKALADEQARSDLIGSVSGVDLQTSDSGSIQGFRYLLHGDEKLFAGNATLWVQRYQQNQVWSRLWKQLAGHEEGNVLVHRSLAEKIPQDKRWKILGLREIDQQGILDDIREKGTEFIQPASLSEDERTEVLLVAQHNRELWQKLPLHETVSGDFTSITDSAYLEPLFPFPEELTDKLQIIKKSSDPRLCRLQNDVNYIQQFTDKTLIKHILNLPTPHNYYVFILDALNRLQGHINPDLQSDLRDMKWLIDEHDISLRPSDIIFLPDIKDEISRLIAAEPGSYYLPESLFEKIRQHPYMPQLKEHFFSQGEDGLEKLALLLELNSDYAVGSLSLGSEDFTSMLNILGKASINQHLPGWRILQSISEHFGLEKCQQYILQSVSKHLSHEKILLVLSWLVEQHHSAEGEKESDIFVCHLRYLDVFSNLKNALDLLPGIKLFNQGGDWRPATVLCADAEGVSPLFILDEQQRKSLTSLVPRQERKPVEEPGDSAESKNAQMPVKMDLQPELQTTIEHLSDYFGQWEAIIQPEVICGFLSMLGDDSRMLHLAENFQGRHSVEWIRHNVPWQVHHHEDKSGRKEWLYGLTYLQALSQHRFIVELVSGQEVTVTSLTGEAITVALNDTFSSLVIGKPFYEWPDGEINNVRIKLRRVSDEQVSPDQFAECLKTTSEYLLRAVYTQNKCDLTPLWDELGKSEQLDVRIALRLVMMHIPLYLDQLGVHKDNLLKRAYNSLNEASYKAVEYRDIPEQSEKYQREEEACRQGLQKLLESDSAVQHVVLESVRRKMRDYQYTVKSIPFELYQNADDAFVEQLEIEAYPEPLNTTGIISDQETAHFVVQQDGDTVRFMHWGRPVNSTGAGGFPGRDRGFHQDLEKMLILSSSNKSSEQHLTGKFGLGFKSVLLVSVSPPA